MDSEESINVGKTPVGTEVPTGADNRLIILIGGAMEDKLFYAYLKYQKDSMRNAWSNLLKLHWRVLVPFAISIISTVITLVQTLVSPLCGWNWISVAIMVLSYIVLMHTTEDFQIKRSHEKFVEYCDYCAEMKIWLAGFSVDSKEKTASIRERILGKISNIRNAHEKSTVGVDKWLQGFATPVVIAVITAVVAGENATEEKIVTTVIVIMIFALAWYLCSVGAKMLNYNSKRKVEQLECFASDLQGILDTQFEGGIVYQGDDSGTESND